MKRPGAGHQTQAALAAVGGLGVVLAVGALGWYAKDYLAIGKKARGAESSAMNGGRPQLKLRPDAPQPMPVKAVVEEPAPLPERRVQAPAPKPAAPVVAPKPPPPPPKAQKRATRIYLANSELTPPEGPGLYTLPVWRYIPCTLENVLSSEIEGHFTVTVRRPILDATGRVTLIPQGARIGAKDDTNNLLLGE